MFDLHSSCHTYLTKSDQSIYSIKHLFCFDCFFYFLVCFSFFLNVCAHTCNRRKLIGNSKHKKKNCTNTRREGTSLKGFCESHSKDENRGSVSAAARSGDAFSATGPYKACLDAWMSQTGLGDEQVSRRNV